MIAGLLIGLIPALALVLCLLAGRYPGERSLAAIRSAIHRGPRPRVAPPRLAARPPRVTRTGGGLLIGLSLAGRAPPLRA